MLKGCLGKAGNHQDNKNGADITYSISIQVSIPKKTFLQIRGVESRDRNSALVKHNLKVLVNCRLKCTFFKFSKSTLLQKEVAVALLLICTLCLVMLLSFIYFTLEHFVFVVYTLPLQLKAFTCHFSHSPFQYNIPQSKTGELQQVRTKFSLNIQT